MSTTPTQIMTSTANLPTKVMGTMSPNPTAALHVSAAAIQPNQARSSEVKMLEFELHWIEFRHNQSQ